MKQEMFDRAIEIKKQIDEAEEVRHYIDVYRGHALDLKIDTFSTTKLKVLNINLKARAAYNTSSIYLPKYMVSALLESVNNKIDELNKELENL